jgi:hypothetical protein
MRRLRSAPSSRKSVARSTVRRSRRTLRRRPSEKSENETSSGRRRAGNGRGRTIVVEVANEPRSGRDVAAVVGIYRQ